MGCGVWPRTIPTSDLYAESRDADVVIRYMQAHFGDTRYFRSS